MAKKTKDHSSQLDLFATPAPPDDLPPETPAALAASSSAGPALHLDAPPDSVKEETTTTENSAAVTTPDAPDVLITDPRAMAIPISHDAPEGSIATEPRDMTPDGESVTVAPDTNSNPNSGSPVPEQRICENQPGATTDVAADSATDARSAEAPSEHLEAGTLDSDSNPRRSDNASDDQCTEDHRPDEADFAPQAPVPAGLESRFVPTATPASDDQATSPATTEQPDRAKAQQSAIKHRGQRKPSRKPLLLIATGLEALKARAATLHAALATAAGLSELQMHSPGPPAQLTPVILDAVKRNYIAHDSHYKRALAEHVGNPALLGHDEYLAGERARKTIERAMGDLAEIGAVETDADGNPVALQRFPEVKRLLASWGATHVRKCSGGGRKLCDAAGGEIRSPLSKKPTPADKPLEQDHEAA